ncbi:hypothetical protein DSECCO2_628710 [anaerobic digester metagenome]
MFRKIIFFAFIAVVAGVSITCTKTYEDGPLVSFCSKFSRITGKWRLVSMEGVERLNPEVEQYMELTKEELSEGVYRAEFTNFQEEVCLCDSNNNPALTEFFFTINGTWTFIGPSEDYYDFEDESFLTRGKQGLKIEASNGNYYFTSVWKILRLEKKELIIKTLGYVQNDTDPCWFVDNPMRSFPVKLTFEKK